MRASAFCSPGRNIFRISSSEIQENFVATSNVFPIVHFVASGFASPITCVTLKVLISDCKLNRRTATHNVVVGNALQANAMWGYVSGIGAAGAKLATLFKPHSNVGAAHSVSTGPRGIRQPAHAGG